MKELDELRDTVARLRAPGGCPWDREQTHESLLPCLVEECSEVLEAVDNRDFALLEEELGDLLLSVFMHAEIAAETGKFDLASVARAINEKLVRRHPHVFGPRAGDMDTGAVLRQWEEIKLREKADRGIAAEGLFKDLPPRLPALLHAVAVAKRFRKKNLPPVPSYEPARRRREDEESVGRLLFDLCAHCDRQGWDPETLLRRHCDRVRREAGAAAGG
ncbi:MAG: MazG family protein [Puniceicoccaceae bacterium]